MLLLSGQIDSDVYMVSEKHIMWSQLAVGSMQAESVWMTVGNNSSITSPTKTKPLTSFPEPQITKGRNCYEYVDGKDESQSNWMR